MAEEVVLCKNGHKTKTYNQSTSPHRNWTCDYCGGRPTYPVCICQACDFDSCAECSKDKLDFLGLPAMECDRGHRIRTVFHKIDVGSVAGPCSLCGSQNVFPQGVCDECRIVLCKNCLRKARRICETDDTPGDVLTDIQCPLCEGVFHDVKASHLPPNYRNSAYRCDGCGKAFSTGRLLHCDACTVDFCPTCKSDV